VLGAESYVDLFFYFYFLFYFLTFPFPLSSFFPLSLSPLYFSSPSRPPSLCLLAAFLSPHIMPEDQPRPGPGFDKIENFNFLLSRTDPAAKNRHYSFDADTGLVPFANVNMDYDQTEGMGGLSVSSYDSIEDDRASLDLRGYPYHGMCFYFFYFLFFFSVFFLNIYII